MSRSSPGVGRVAAILNFIADHPGQAFALTDLVRALKLSRATCHALLTGLVDVGYLYRTSDKTYVLGPVLARIARNATQHFSPLQVAQPEMRGLADEFDVVCAAYFLEGDTIHLRDRAASRSHVGYPVPMGNRMTLRWSLAVAYYAWSPTDAEAWLQRTDRKPSEERLELMWHAMAFAREHGFVPLILGEGFRPLKDSPLPARDIDGESNDAYVLPVGEVDPAQDYTIAGLMAPVFDAKGKVSFALVMAGFNDSLNGRQVLEAGGKLRAAVQRISDFVAGKAGDRS